MLHSPVGDSCPSLSPAFPQKMRTEIVRKCFPLITWLQGSAALVELLGATPELAEIAARRKCVSDMAWPAAAQDMLLTNEEIEQAGDALARLAQDDSELAKLIAHRIRPSGAYWTGVAVGADVLIRQAWQVTAVGINGIIGAYALGWQQNYPAIDSPSYAPDWPGYAAIARASIERSAAAAQTGHALFYEPSLDFALDLLAFNRRDEAGRFEPMEQGENKAALAHLATIDWDDFPYAAMIIHGIGAGVPGIAMSEQTIANCANAAERYRNGQAPVIIPTGGACHPKQTPFHEAIEMKRELVFAHGIPEHAILIDPHARHTTTNLRNPARLLAKAGAPWGKPCLSVTIPEQIDLLANPQFLDFCVQVLGYAPMVLGERPDPTSLELTLQEHCLLVDPRDPLDP